MELADGVYSFPLAVSFPDRELTIHPAGVETDDGLVLVDAGYADRLDVLADALDAHGFAFDDIEYVVVTHQDGDHAGGLAELLAETDAPVLASPGDTPVIEGDREPLKSGGDRYDPVPVDIRVTDGTELRTAAGPLRVVETPGHTPGHVSLHVPNRDLLLAADALIADDDGLQGPSTKFTPEYEQATESVGRLANLDADATLCFHGGFVEHGPGGVADVYESLTE